ncbi:hypothetical protein SASPL_145480 [Salvia splendens]|uniref:7-dehydrocholesterol reductase n=1 Tax=Salvia splendens TaxID=180675 RepID=A0A8X8Z8E6_SALSN|nr:hypothetical protein SASPL_145480 [Salvia splendens]
MPATTDLQPFHHSRFPQSDSAFFFNAGSGAVSSFLSFSSATLLVPTPWQEISAIITLLLSGSPLLAVCAVVYPCYRSPSAGAEQPLLELARVTPLLLPGLVRAATGMGREFLGIEDEREMPGLGKSTIQDCCLVHNYYRSNKEQPFTFTDIRMVSHAPNTLHVKFLPYFYVVFLMILLFDQAKKDDDRCKTKYGKYWKLYCDKVPSRIIPGIYL